MYLNSTSSTSRCNFISESSNAVERVSKKRGIQCAAIRLFQIQLLLKRSSTRLSKYCEINSHTSNVMPPMKPDP